MKSSQSFIPPPRLHWFIRGWSPPREGRKGRSQRIEINRNLQKSTDTSWVVSSWRIGWFFSGLIILDHCVNIIIISISLPLFLHTLFLSLAHTSFLPHATLSPLFYFLLLPLALSHLSLPCLLSFTVFLILAIYPLFFLPFPILI